MDGSSSWTAWESLAGLPPEFPSQHSPDYLFTGHASTCGKMVGGFKSGMFADAVGLPGVLGDVVVDEGDDVGPPVVLDKITCFDHGAR